MNDEEFEQKRNQLKRELETAKRIQSYAERVYENSKEETRVAGERMVIFRTICDQVERKLYDLEWKHGLLDSPECTGTEY